MIQLFHMYEYYRTLQQLKCPDCPPCGNPVKGWNSGNLNSLQLYPPTDPLWYPTGPTTHCKLHTGICGSYFCDRHGTTFLCHWTIVWNFTVFSQLTGCLINTSHFNMIRAQSIHCQVVIQSIHCQVVIKSCSVTSTGSSPGPWRMLLGTSCTTGPARRV
jgi:hypothetical protein